MPTRLIKVSRNRAVRKIIGRVTNSGAVAIAAGQGFTAVRNGTGDVTITPKKPGRVFLAAFATPIQSTAATSHSVKVLAATVSAIQFGSYVADATDGAPADMDFSFEITMQDHA